MNDNLSETTEAPTRDLIVLSADIVAAYISHNSLPVGELAGLIARVHQAVAGLENGSGASAAPAALEVERPSPAQVRKSVAADGIVSFIDGKSYKTLKRHLGRHGLEPNSYRDRYGLPSNYPMVAPSYAAQRSALAKSIGLGRKDGMVRAETSAEEGAPAPKRRGRKAA